MSEHTTEKAQHPTPPGPSGPPMHTHEDGSRCMWVRHGFIDRWRQVSAPGRDLGPCPGFACDLGPCSAMRGHEGTCAEASGWIVTCEDLGCENGMTVQGRKYYCDDTWEEQWAPCGRHANTCPPVSTPPEPTPWVAFPGSAPVCRDCGADWRPVRRGECASCGSDAGPSELPTSPGANNGE